MSLTVLLQSWEWSVDCQWVFQHIKRVMTDEIVLSLPDHAKQFEVQTYALDYVIGGVLMQDGHSVVFQSRKLNKAKRRYTIQEKEMIMVVH